MIDPATRCPCRKKSETVSYDRCCGPCHAGTHLPETAVALMRSRYSAFALGNAPYLLATWHASTRPASLDLDPAQQWTMLKVLAHEPAGDHAVVAFSAQSRIGGRVYTLTERSRFIREDGRWSYIDGDVA